MEEALAMISDEDHEVSQIFMEPPESNVLTDEDSGDEDGGLLDNLSGRQLRVGGEVVVKNSGEQPEEQTEESEQDGGHTKTKSDTKKSKKVSVETEWIEGDLISPLVFFPNSSYETYNEESLYDTFCKIFDNDIYGHLIQETEKYAASKSRPEVRVTKQDLEIFLAILILSGYNTVPFKRNYWDSQGDLRNEYVYTSMRRDRFLTISRYLHCADNSFPSYNDKM
ncbi:Transposase IS4 [Popillia japonica]|uniref:Transposase IS4 n=1 Tax=Popillia japonica TaxID=7064 RepID=A0AAW1N9G2_POPJA